MMFDIDIEKLMNDSLYLDNQAHAVVSRMRDMDSGTRTQLRRLYGAVRRAVTSLTSTAMPTRRRGRSDKKADRVMAEAISPPWSSPR